MPALHDIPRDDPKEEVGSFDRPRRRRGGGDPEYLPNRVIAERCWFFEERAAIREYLGGFERWIAERLAHEDMVNEHKAGRLR